MGTFEVNIFGAYVKPLIESVQCWRVFWSPMIWQFCRVHGYFGAFSSSSIETCLGTGRTTHKDSNFSLQCLRKTRAHVKCVTMGGRVVSTSTVILAVPLYSGGI
jgi:hypothetical protein